MFSLVSGVYDAYFASPQVNILVVGAQGVGKTTVLERLKVTNFRKRPPPPGIQRTAMPDELLRLIRGQEEEEDDDDEEEDEASRTRPTPAQTRRKGAQQPSQPAAVPSSPSVTAELGTPKKTRKRLTWVCPAPKRYSIQNMQDDEDEEEEAVVGLLEGTPPVLPDLSRDDDDAPPPVPAPQPPSYRSSVGSLDSVELPAPPASSATTTSNASAAAAATETDQSSSQTTVPTPQQRRRRQESQTPPAAERLEFDVLPRCKMISLAKIRPTIGMNLGKVDLCGAKCHVMDLGGRLAELWQRYYADCDAVVFVYKLGGGQDDLAPTTRDDDQDDDQDERPEITHPMQRALLNQVRASIGDDIPFLVLGHAFGARRLCPVPTGPLYQTEQLLPHYHSTLQTFMVANAATGQGVQAAMEWLVPLAKRQHALREKGTEKLPA